MSTGKDLLQISVPDITGLLCQYYTCIKKAPRMRGCSTDVMVIDRKKLVVVEFAPSLPPAGQFTGRGDTTTESNGLIKEGI